MGVGWNCKYPCSAREAFLQFRDGLPEMSTKVLAWHYEECYKTNGGFESKEDNGND